MATSSEFLRGFSPPVSQHQTPHQSSSTSPVKPFLSYPKDQLGSALPHKNPQTEGAENEENN